MIHVDFREPTSIEWKLWRQRCDNQQTRHNEAIEAGRESRVDSELYKGQKDETYMALDGPFHGKCAYCEQKIYGDQRGDMEHFRPKNAVKDENNRPITREVNCCLEEHPGYYWLVYHWGNLLPSCISCNQLSKERMSGRTIGKGNQFPVKGFRAWRQGEDELEVPLLLHPAVENPEEHLWLDELGMLRSESERGAACISIFGLNDRDLPNDRRRKYEDVKQKMQLLAQAAARNPNSQETKKLLNELNRIKEGYGEFTLAARKAINETSASVIGVFRIVASGTGNYG